MGLVFITEGRSRTAKIPTLPLLAVHHHKTIRDETDKLNVDRFSSELLEILRLPGFSGAQSEFLKAHEHYREGRNTEAVIECHKAFEIIMKAICTKRRWTFDSTKAAFHLIDVCISN